MLKALLVDDEEPALLELEYVLQSLTDRIEIVGKAQSGKQALKLIRRLRPDVLFLDIKLGDMDGFAVAEEAMQYQPYIVFVTACDQYAIRAFEINALDYILKPFSQERVELTLEKLLDESRGDPRLKETVQRDYNGIAATRGFNKITVMSGSKMMLVDFEDIVFAEADGRNSFIYTGDNKYRCKLSLKRLEEKLEGYFFFKPHRSYLINLDKIKEIIPWFNGEYKIVLDGYDKLQITVTRNNVKRFKEILEV